MEDPPLRVWADVAESVVAWHPLQKHWGRGRAIYFSVICVDAESNTASASLLDPCFPADLGSAKAQRFLVDTGVHLELQGNHLESLLVGTAYVAYGTLAPVELPDGAFRVCLPRCSSKAGVSRMLGTGVAAFSARTKQGCSKPLNVAELFCGGMGGWTQAIRRSKGFKTILALDSDPLASEWFIQNNGGCSCVQGEFFLQDFATGTFPVFTCDINDKSWYQTFLTLPCDVVTASFPCTPWSAMGAQHGLQGQPGQALLAFLSMLRLLQPMSVGLENVPGFRAGPEYDKFCEQLQLAGYQIMYSTVHELANVAVASRRRWLAVAVSTLFLTKPERVHTWAHPLLHMPVYYQPSLHSTTFQSQDACFAWDVSDEEYSILRQYPVAPESNLPFNRVVQRGMVIPTYTASYRSSLNFAAQFLKSKGLYAWLIQDAAGRHRWFSPMEAALTMGFPLETMLPVNPVDAIRLVGNAIAPAQAALALVYLEKMLYAQTGRACNESFLKFLEAFGHHNLDLRDLQIVANDSAVFVCQKTRNPSCKKRSADSLHEADTETHALSKPLNQASLPSAVQAAQGPTQPYPDVIYGQLLDESPSGFVDPYGVFLKASPIVRPQRWQEWILQSGFKKDLDGYMVSYDSRFVPDGHVFFPGYKYVLQMHRLVPGGPGHVSGIFDLQKFPCFACASKFVAVEAVVDAESVPAPKQYLGYSRWTGPN